MSNQPQNVSGFQNGIGSMPQTMNRPISSENQGPTMNASSKLQQTSSFLPQSAQQPNYYQYSATQASALNGDHSTTSFKPLNKLQNASHQQIPQQNIGQPVQTLPSFIGQKIPSQNAINTQSSQSISSVPQQQNPMIYSNGPGSGNVPNQSVLQGQMFQQQQQQNMINNKNNGQILPAPPNITQQPLTPQHFNGTPVNSATSQQFRQNQILPPGANSVTQNINTLIPNLQNISLAPPQPQPSKQLPPPVQTQMPQNMPLRTPINNNPIPPPTSQFQNVPPSSKPAVRPMYPLSGTQPPVPITNNQQYNMPQQPQYKPPQQYPQQQSQQQPQMQQQQQQMNTNVYNGQQQQPPFGQTTAPLQYQPQHNVVQSGFNKLWGHPDTIDLMQQRHILPHDGVHPPQISLNNQFSDSVNCDPE